MLIFRPSLPFNISHTGVDISAIFVVRNNYYFTVSYYPKIDLEPPQKPYYKKSQNIIVNHSIAIGHKTLESFATQSLHAIFLIPH